MPYREYLDQQADALAQAGRDLEAKQVRAVSAHIGALEQRVDMLESEATDMQRRLATAEHAARTAQQSEIRLRRQLCETVERLQAMA